MSNIATKAKELLESKAVQVIVGYEEGTNGVVRPAFITNPDKANSLIYDNRCVQNLAVYLTKHEVKHFGKIGIVANLPIMRSIMVLISEQQVNPENIVILGISDDGNLLDIANISIMKTHIEKSNLANPSQDQLRLAELNKMSIEERFKFWEAEMSKCIKCYACRQSCPMCYCIRCSTECNQPQILPVQANTHGNMEWHMLRAMHLAGRCISCGECGRACPVNIPCHLLTMQLSDKVIQYFNVHTGTSSDMKSVMSTYEPNDKESFII